MANTRHHKHSDPSQLNTIVTTWVQTLSLLHSPGPGSSPEGVSAMQSGIECASLKTTTFSSRSVPQQPMPIRPIDSSARVILIPCFLTFGIASPPPANALSAASKPAPSSSAATRYRQQATSNSSEMTSVSAIRPQHSKYIRPASKLSALSAEIAGPSSTGSLYVTRLNRGAVTRGIICTLRLGQQTRCTCLARGLTA